VRAQLQAQLAPGVQLQRAHVWLVAAPTGVEQDVWHVVAAAALSAIEKGRRALFARAREEQEEQQRGGRQVTLEEAWRLEGPPPASPAERLSAGAGRVAAERLWELLQDFANTQSGLGGWGPKHGWLPPDAPFLCGVPGQQFAVRVHARAAAAAAAAADADVG
jgi:hypothetical protein